MAFANFQRYPTPVNDTIAGGASAAAPGSGTSFVTPAVPEAGIYKLDVIYTITGAVETLPTNVRLTINGATFCVLPSGAGVNAVYRFTFDRVTLDGVNAPTLKANAAAAVSTVYAGTIAYSRIA